MDFLQAMQTADILDKHIDVYRTEMMAELACVSVCMDKMKDILIVVHNQLPYLQVCIKSIFDHTDNFHLYIWDNNSGEETRTYLEGLAAEHNEVSIVHGNQNLGFIIPNNTMADWGQGEYIILLNSDTRVFDGWDKAMLGYLQQHPDVGLIGYLGGELTAEGRGGQGTFGSKVDYVCGWCCCFSRQIYNEFGLFDNKLQFAYCEDSDFSLRLATAGKSLYALHLLLVHHYENKTIVAVQEEGSIDVAKTFRDNHEYFRLKWQDYLSNNRFQLRKDSSHELASNLPG